MALFLTLYAMRSLTGFLLKYSLQTLKPIIPSHIREIMEFNIRLWKIKSSTFKDDFSV